MGNRSSKFPWGPFVGHDVRIEWRDPDDNWRYFFVVSENRSLARLRGIDDPETGNRHAGNEFDAKWSDVISIAIADDLTGEKPTKPPWEYGEESTVLKAAQKTVDSRDKAAHYGPPEESMRRIGLIWSGILGVEVTAEKAALLMLGLKAARLSVDPRHFDSLVDSAGYVRILERLSRGKK